MRGGETPLLGRAVKHLRQRPLGPRRRRRRRRLLDEPGPAHRRRRRAATPPPGWAFPPRPERAAARMRSNLSRVAPEPTGDVEAIQEPAPGVAPRAEELKGTQHGDADHVGGLKMMRG